MSKNTKTCLGEFCYIIQDICKYKKCKDCIELTVPDKEE
jgi:hypothetical protein